MDKKTDLAPTGMAARYEQAWNFVVENLDPWKKTIVIKEFEIVSGECVYRRADKRIIDEVTHEVARLAESEGWTPPAPSEAVSKSPSIFDDDNEPF